MAAAGLTFTAFGRTGAQWLCHTAFFRPPCAGSQTHFCGFVSLIIFIQKNSSFEEFLLVAAAGLEPTAHSLGNCCSILMSYAATQGLRYNQNHKKASIFYLLSIPLNSNTGITLPLPRNNHLIFQIKSCLTIVINSFPHQCTIRNFIPAIRKRVKLFVFI